MRSWAQPSTLRMCWTFTNHRELILKSTISVLSSRLFFQICCFPALIMIKWTQYDIFLAYLVCSLWSLNSEWLFSQLLGCYSAWCGLYFQSTVVLHGLLSKHCHSPIVSHILPFQFGDPYTLLRLYSRISDSENSIAGRFLHVFILMVTVYLSRACFCWFPGFSNIFWTGDSTLSGVFSPEPVCVDNCCSVL